MTKETCSSQGVWETKKGRRRSRVLSLNENVSHWFTYLISWSLVGDTVWGGCGTFRKQNIVGRSTSLGSSFNSIEPCPGSSLPSVSCVRINMCSLSFLLQQPCPSSVMSPTITDSPSGTISQNKSLWVMVLYQSNKKITNTHPNIYFQGTAQSHNFLLSPTS